MERRRVNVRGVIYREGKILALKHLQGDSEVDYWATPGGGVDQGESLVKALERETVEELGVRAKVGRLLFVQQFCDDDRSEKLEFFFLVENPDDFMGVDLAATSHGAVEIARLEWLDPRSVQFMPRFLREVDLDDYALNVRPVGFWSYLV
jgi:ADP-ribose pyrophosphatase YjhB (NUDIX family)